MQQAMYLHTGDRVRLKMPYSEVMAHMGIADQVFEVQILDDAAQLYKDGRPYSIPVLWGEAGIYRDQMSNLPYAYGVEIVKV